MASNDYTCCLVVHVCAREQGPEPPVESLCALYIPDIQTSSEGVCMRRSIRCAYWFVIGVALVHCLVFSAL